MSTKVHMANVPVKGEALMSASKKTDSAYPISADGLWHSGIHIKGKSAIHNIYEGTVVALRLSDEYQDCYVYNKIPVQWLRFVFSDIPDTIEEFFDVHGDDYVLKETLNTAQKAQAFKFANSLFSHNCVLIRHEAQNSGQSPIVFYSLIMHLRPLGTLSCAERCALVWYTKNIRQASAQYDAVKIYTNTQCTIQRGSIPCETPIRVDSNDSTTITWTLNGVSDSAHVKTSSYHTVSGQHIIKKKGSSASATTISASECIQRDGIVLYSQKTRSKRSVLYQLPARTTLSLSDTDIFTPTALRDGIAVSCMYQGLRCTGYIYADYTTVQKDSLAQTLTQWLTQTAPDKTLKVGNLDITLTLAEGVQRTGISSPTDNTIAAGAILGYAGYKPYRCAKEAEPAISESLIHYEIFCPSVSFMTSDAKEVYPCTYTVNAPCTVYRSQPKTQTTQKTLTVNGAALSNIASVYAKITESGACTDVEHFYNLSVLANISENEYFVTSTDFDTWDGASQTASVKTDTTVSVVYSKEGRIIPGAHLCLLKGYNYRYADRADVSVNGTTLHLRKPHYSYTARSDSQSFWISESTYRKSVSTLKKDNHCIIHTAVPASQILDLGGIIFTGEKTISQGELHDTGTQLIEYTAVNKNTHKEVWKLMKGTESYWLKAHDIGDGTNTPIRRIKYNDWLYFFTRLDNAPADYALKDFKALIQNAPDLAQRLTATLTEYRKKSSEIPFGRIINEDAEAFEALSRLVYKRTTEWKKDAKLTTAIYKNSTSNKKRIELERDKLVFWDDAQKLKVKGFPSSPSNWYFHPARFIEHLNKVAIPREFNPYENYSRCFANEGGWLTGNHLEDVQLSVGTAPKSNPGFAPLATQSQTTDEFPLHTGVRYARCSSPFNIKRVQSGSTQHNVNTLRHTGIDLSAAGAQTPIMALISGSVWAYTYDDAYGNVLIVKDLDKPVLYFLAHLASCTCGAGQRIIPGDEVAVVGKSGTWGGDTSHLHLEVYHCKTNKIDDVLDATKNKVPDSGPDGYLKWVWKDTVRLGNRRNPFNHNEKYIT